MCLLAAWCGLGSCWWLLFFPALMRGLLCPWHVLIFAHALQVFCSILLLKPDLVNISSASAPGSWLVVTVSCSAPRPALVGVCRPRAQRHVTLVSKAVPPAARRLSQFFIINAYCFSSPEGSIFLPV
jgi:hypothetical protein